MKTAARFFSCLAATLILLHTAGCSDSRTQASRAAQTSHLRTLISLYNAASAKIGRPPADEASFKQFIVDDSMQVLEKMQIASADDLFISERDGQPFVVRYRHTLKFKTPNIVAYEQTGVDGRRQIGFRLGVIEEVDAQRFAELVPEAAPEDDKDNN